MSRTSSAVKRKYNKTAYDRHEFSVGKDTELAHKLMAEKRSGKSISELIKKLLCEHYDISMVELHDYQSPIRAGQGNEADEGMVQP